MPPNSAPKTASRTFANDYMTVQELIDIVALTTR